MGYNVLYKSSLDRFDWLDDTEKTLEAMCGVGSFNNTRIFSTESRPVLLTKSAIEKYNLKDSKDFSGLIGKEAYVIRRQRDENNNKIPGRFKAYKISIVEFMCIDRYDWCWVRCKDDKDSIDDILVYRLFHYPNQLDQEDGD